MRDAVEAAATQRGREAWEPDQAAGGRPRAPTRGDAAMAEHVKARGGEIRTSAPVKEIVTNDDGTVAGLAMRDGTTVTADEYVSAVPVDIFRR